MTNETKYWMVARGDVVALTASEHDAFVGGVWTVVDTEAHDALLVCGDLRHDMPALDDSYDLAINVRRLVRLA